MTDVSPARRRLGRWLLAGGALALPLTASVSYAAQDVQPVPVAPSAAPEAPLPPEPPVPPMPSVAPRAPVPPLPPQVREERHVIKHDRDAKGAKREYRTFVFRGDGPLSAEQRKHFEAMSKEWEKKGAEWRKRGAEFEKMAKEHRQMALAFADRVPEVSRDCDKAGENGTRSWTDDSGRQHVVICERIVRDRAEMAERQGRMALPRAMMGLRGAREMIANNPDMSASVKQEVLADLDREIARLEAEQK